MNYQSYFDEVWPDIDAVPGWMSPGQEKRLFELVRSLPGQARILELGSFLGRSTVSMAFACRDTHKHIYAVDSFEGNDNDFVSGKNEVYWEGNDFLDTFKHHLERNNLLRYVTPLRGWTHDIAPHWTLDVDMIFIDAGHTYEDVSKDVKDYFDFVKPGGIVALHDVTPGWPDVLKVWQELVAPRLEDIDNQGSLYYGTKPKK